MLSSSRLLLLAPVPVVLLAVTTAPAAAVPPEPVAGTPSCSGLYAAYNNDKYGPSTSPSGNDRANVGPGYIFKQDTAETIKFLSESFCS